MTTIERLRLTVIEEVLAGTITNSTAATKLNVTVRQIQRLKKGFKVRLNCKKVLLKRPL